MEKNEGNNQSNDNGIIWFSGGVIATAFLVALVTYFMTTSHYSPKLKEMEDVHALQMVNQAQQVYDLTAVNVDLAIEVIQLKQRLAEKSSDKTLAFDIAMYIHENYPTIPEVLYHEIAVQIATLSQIENVAPELVVGVIEVESSFNPMAISGKNARGLMQVMPMWAKYFNLNKVCDLHNVDVGISTGIKVLKVHIKEEDGNISKGLFKYVNKDRSYVDKVYTAMGKFVMFRGLIADNKGDVNDSNSTTAEADSGSDGDSEG